MGRLWVSQWRFWGSRQMCQRDRVWAPEDLRPPGVMGEERGGQSEEEEELGSIKSEVWLIQH